MSISSPLTQLDSTATRSYRGRVQHITRLSENFTRIAFTGDDLDSFAATGLDQHVHLLFPDPEADFDQVLPREFSCTLCALGDVGTAAQLPAGQLRTFTVRRASAVLRLIEIDFVLHSGSGIANQWARSARVGDELTIIAGPTTSPAAAGLTWRPGGATRYLLLGDETALPAISAIAAALPSHVRTEAIIEVPTADDIVPIHAGAHVGVHWLPRLSTNGKSNKAPGELLLPTVSEWAVRTTAAFPQLTAGQQSHADTEPAIPAVAAGNYIAQGKRSSPYYVWAGGNQHLVQALTKLLINDHQADPNLITRINYWS